MSKQYFENNPNLNHQYTDIVFSFKGITIKLVSDLGVFSKNKVDYGTIVLLKWLPIIHGTVLDVGCGYGPIGISLAKAYPNAFVEMVDVNNRALELSKNNASDLLNVNIFNSDIYSKITKKYDFIVSNPPIRAGKKVVHQIILGAYDYLNDHGEIWTVIQKKQGANSAIKEMELKYQNVSVVANDRDYLIIRGIKECR